VTRAPLLGREAYPARERFDLRWDDADRYGHVNNTVHYRLFDSAVNRWLLGQGLLDFEQGPICLVAETGCRYAAPLEFPGEVEVGLGLERLGSSSMTWRLGLFGAGDAAAAEGRFIHVLVDRDMRRPVPLPQPWREALEAAALRP